MKEYNYDIDNLSFVFEEHAKKFDLDFKEHAKKHGHDHFNLSRALACICNEIKELKERENNGLL